VSRDTFTTTISGAAAHARGFASGHCRDYPSAADLEQDERESRRRAEQARRRQRAERLAAGLPEVEMPTPENGHPF